MTLGYIGDRIGWSKDNPTKEQEACVTSAFQHLHVHLQWLILVLRMGGMVQDGWRPSYMYSESKTS